MEVDLGRRARDLLEAGGLDVEYHESDVGHQIDRTQLPAAIAWLGTTLGLDDA
jgi:phospholipase/carboxylesterase